MNLHIKKLPPVDSVSHTPHFKRERKLEFPSDTELRSFREEKIKIIQKAWFSYLDRIVFRLLKHATCALVMSDTYKLMGVNKLYNQIMEDDLIHNKFEISDEIDVITIRDYMQYSNLLDQIPASRGGKNNPWRRIELRHIPKTMMIYDIIDFVQSGTLSKRLRKELRFLIQKPQSEKMNKHQLEIITKVRMTEPKRLVQPPTKMAVKKIRPVVRNPKQALKEVERLKKVCMASKNETVKIQAGDKPSLKQTVLLESTFTRVKTNELQSHSNNDENLKMDEQELFDWCQKLLTSQTVNTTKDKKTSNDIDKKTS